jgi:hypothetical protein
MTYEEKKYIENIIREELSRRNDAFNTIMATLQEKNKGF